MSPRTRRPMLRFERIGLRLSMRRAMVKARHLPLQIESKAHPGTRQATDRRRPDHNGMQRCGELRGGSVAVLELVPELASDARSASRTFAGSSPTTHEYPALWPRSRPHLEGL